MLGYDISWAGFNIIEVMSSSRFTCKRIGYLAASQCFHPDSEVSTALYPSITFLSYIYACSCPIVLQLLMLTTNMIRKDLNSQNQYDAGVALSGLSCFISTDLSRDLANDIMTLVRQQDLNFPYTRITHLYLLCTADELNETLSAHEGCAHDVQGISALSRSIATCVSQTQREAGGSRSRHVPQGLSLSL